MVIEPAGHRILIKPDPVEEHDEILKSAQEAGIEVVKDKVTARAEKAAQIYGTVVAVGKTAWKDFGVGEPWAKVGDKVSYSKYGGIFIKDPSTEEELVLINDEDLICIIKDAKDDR